VHAADTRAAAAELAYLARALAATTELGPYTITGQLARSATALLYTATGGALGQVEGVLKLTGTAYAPILDRELRLLQTCAAAGIAGVVRPASAELLWLRVGDRAADRLAAALALPFLGGGDLLVVAERAARTGRLGPALAVEATRPLATTLRRLAELDPPLAHGDLRPPNVLLPRPGAGLDELTLIDFDAAREVTDDPAPLAEDVRALGELLQLLAGGRASAGRAPANEAFDLVPRRCLAGDYASVTDPRLWSDLAAAEAQLASRA
jgi:hypothetical protein